MHWLIFAGLGPPIGLMTLLVIMAINEGKFSLGFLLAAAIAGLPFAYIVGLLPALLGAFAVWVLQIRQVSRQWLWVGIGAPVTGSLFMAASSIVAGGDPFSAPSTAYMSFALIFFVSGSSCWYLSKRFDESFR